MKLTDFIEMKPITRGWSKEKKFYVSKEDGERFLLRISPLETYEKKKVFFDKISQVAKLDIPMSKPVEFGICEQGVYYFETWIDGEDAKDVIPEMTGKQQYCYGLKAGEILKKIHSIPAPKSLEDWSSHFNKKIDRKIEKYIQCPIKFQHGDEIISYINQNRYLLNKRPQSFQHGDYHIENMMVQNEELVVIDFGRYDYGDPWEEFNRIIWTADVSPLFASGMIRAYFDGCPPIEFWRLLALYIGNNTIASICWGNFGQSDLETMLGYAQRFYSWYKGMTILVPTWYYDGFS